MATNDEVVPEPQNASGTELAALKHQRSTMKRNLSYMQKNIEK